MSGDQNLHCSANQPEALRLADEVDEVARTYPDLAEVSAELRRLHAVNTQLLAALEDLLQKHEDHFCGAVEWCPVVKARAAVEAAHGITGEKK